MNKRWKTVRERYRTGARVRYDGLYTDGWGGELLLLSGDRFPCHPEMGPTTWTYASVLAHSHSIRDAEIGGLGRL
ncbi:hypothetical protein [Paenibacillus kobensis]|uniref:hypothetical protein n=1 Tax=Paenibacillus kobensis TaxID=59841 RepID=UPI000FD750CC|nr:hypothetical protein [Paenibacillus kobensis]